MKYKLVAADLDGTLLNSERTIPESTKCLIRKFKEEGGIFTIATGRMENSAWKYRDELEIDVPVILYNGAKIYNYENNSVYFDSKLNHDAAKIVLKNSEKYPWNVLVYKDKNIFVSRYNDDINRYESKDGIKCCEVGDLCSYIDSSPTKILIIGPNEKFDEFVKICTNEFGAVINAVNSEPDYLEILPDNVSKGAALEELCRMLNIDLSETVAIGDNRNDLEMIKKAGFGIAVNNAHLDLKKAADFVTSKNDTYGVSEVIEMILQDKL